MSTNHHTPWVDLEIHFLASEMNPALGQLDQAITNVAATVDTAVGDISTIESTVSGISGEVVAARGTETTLDARIDSLEAAIGAAGSGSVTSVGLSLPSELTVSDSPVTVSGTLTGEWVVQAKNKVFAGPVTGNNAVPSFRVLDPEDLPDQPVGWAMFIPGTLTDDQLIYAIIPNFATSIPVNLAGTTVRKHPDNPTSSVTISLKKDGVEFGTIGIGTDGVVTRTSASGCSFNGIDEELSVHAPAVADSLLKDLGIMIKGWR